MSRCFWCHTDPEEAAARHEGPHAKWCLRWRDPGLPEGVTVEVRNGRKEYHFRPPAGAPLSGTRAAFLISDEEEHAS